MANKKPVIVGIFDDEQVLMNAIKQAKYHNFQVADCYTPFPVHGLDKVLNLRPSRLDIVAFAFGGLGFISAIALMTLTMGVDWPMNIGGKPTTPIPTFIPITFELTVLFSALGMAGAFFIRSRMVPGFEPKIYDPRSTSDRFVLLLDYEDEISEELKNVLIDNGAIEVRQDNYYYEFLPSPFKREE